MCMMTFILFILDHSTIYYSAYTDGLNHAYSKAHAMNVFSYFRLNKIII